MLVAYIDPASGSILLQASIALAVGVGAYVVRTAWKIWARVTGRKPPAARAPGEDV
jgi:hypothetical protein